MKLLFNIDVCEIIALMSKIDKLHFYFQAKRVDVKCILLPDENKKDFNDLPTYITDGLEVHFVSTFNDVYHICFAKMDEIQSAKPVTDHVSSTQPTFA